MTMPKTYGVEIYQQKQIEGKYQTETEYTILTGTTSIGNYAFRECTSLTNIEIPDTVKNIGDLAFRECTGMKNIVIPNSVTNIGFDVFYRCTGLKIYCTSDSYAKQYAINNRVKYVIDDEGPIMTNIEENPVRKMECIQQEFRVRNTGFKQQKF